MDYDFEMNCHCDNYGVCGGTSCPNYWSCHSTESAEGYNTFNESEGRWEYGFNDYPIPE